MSARGASRTKDLVAATPSWWTSVLRCPRCGGPLSAAGYLARCEPCGPYPLLGEVPVLVPDPFGYCEKHRDAILAALAEHGVADREAVAVVEAFAGDRVGTPQEGFGDDWTAHEGAGTVAPHPVRGIAAKPLSTLIELAATQGPARWLAQKVQPQGAARGRATGLGLEIGCGTGAFSLVFASVVDRLLVADLSLRAVLRARARASQGAADVVGVVMDAEALPLKKRSVDVMVAENLVDLLDGPADFFMQARAALAKGGRLLVTTPEPSLGASDDDTAERVARAAKFRVVDRRDGLPWLRVNSTRFVEVYVVQAIELT